MPFCSWAELAILQVGRRTPMSASNQVEMGGVANSLGPVMGSIFNLFLSRSAIRRQIRVIEALGPSPIPPLVILKCVPDRVKSIVQESLLRMHTNTQGTEVLAAGGILRFVRVEDRDYDSIRWMEKRAESTSFEQSPAQ